MRIFWLFVRLLGILLINIFVLFILYNFFFLISFKIFLIERIKIENNIEFLAAIVIPFWIALIAYFQEVFKNFIFKRQLLINFEMRKPYITLCDLRQEENDAKVGQALCVKLLIKNIGFGFSKNCYVEIHNRKCGTIEDLSFQSLSLSWTNWKSMYRDVHHKSEGVYVDLIRLDCSSNSSWEFPKISFHGSTKGQETNQIIPGSQNQLITPNAPCSFKVTVYSENSEPVTKEVFLKWNGEWSEDFQEIFEIKLNG